MRLLFRRLWIPFYSFWLLRYIRKERVYTHAGLQLAVPPGVFHPGVFFSTPVFISFLQNIDFQGKTVLDVGTGSGLLALFAARQGALVTALDINPLAVKTARRNAVANGLSIAVVESDLFAGLPPQSFDIILINPPYFPAHPPDAAARAFFTGENWEYFEQLFYQLPTCVNAGTQTWMILSDKCNFEKITVIAAANDFRLTTVFEKKKWGESFQVVAIAPSRILENQQP
jgi:release factor glutamine methyltransferase